MGIKKRKYSKEQKEEIVQRALSGERILQLGKEVNISPGLINRWKRQYLDGELSGNNNQEVKKLQTQVAKLEQMIGKLTMELYFKKRERIPTTEEKRGFIHHYRSLFESIKEGCRLMGIKRSTLYCKPKKNIIKKQKELRIRKKVEDISREHPYYGYRRITASLRRDKVIVNHKKVLKIMQEMGIQGRIKRQYIVTTNSTIIKYTLI